MRRLRSAAPVTAYSAAAMGALAVILLALGPGAWWIGGGTVRALRGAERASAVNDIRQALLTAGTGLAALGALVFTGRSYRLNRRGQLTDRYVKAVSMLASAHATERTGGVFALEHLMRESPTDHDTVVQVLAGFVREQCPLPADRPTIPDRERAPADRPYRCAIDVQAALTVLGRRPARDEHSPIDLSGCDLRGVDLVGARLDGARFIASWLDGAQLHDASMVGAHLDDAFLAEAGFARADLSRAVLVRVQAQLANFFNARITGAFLQDADLTSAGLSQATLHDSHMASARFDGADLERADLRGTYLVLARFDQAVLYGADLGGCDAQRVQFGGADLRHAALIGANLTDIRVESLDRAKLETLLWRQRDRRRQVLAELVDTLDTTNPDHANLTGIIVDPVNAHRFPATPLAPPLGHRQSGYYIDQEPAT